jgi:hypothetical protein
VRGRDRQKHYLIPLSPRGPRQTLTRAAQGDP